jgi:hypothetical protein
METSKQTSKSLIREEIASTAYNLWEQAGRPSAQDVEFWLQAERLLTQSGQAQSANPKATTQQQVAPTVTKAVSALRATSF